MPSKCCNPWLGDPFSFFPPVGTPGPGPNIVVATVEEGAVNTRINVTFETDDWVLDTVPTSWATDAPQRNTLAALVGDSVPKTLVLFMDGVPAEGQSLIIPPGTTNVHGPNGEPVEGGTFLIDFS